MDGSNFETAAKKLSWNVKAAAPSDRQMTRLQLRTMLPKSDACSRPPRILRSIKTGRNTAESTLPINAVLTVVSERR